jgi:hypothetical protein
MAFNRKEAEEWWSSLSETFKSDLLGIRGSGDSETAPMLF